MRLRLFVSRERLENAQEECERLTQTLSDLIYWTETQTARILEDQPVAGDLDTVQKQRELVKVRMKTHQVLFIVM